MRYFLRLSFFGTDYHGWQVQENARSVQQELNEAISVLLKQKTETVGCGRTDTGVHAKKFFAHFDSELISDTKEFTYHLNAILSRNIAVHSLFEVASDAHARFSATERTYHYLIHQEKNPFLDGRSWFYPHALNVERMNSMAKILYEYHDFTSFSKGNTQTFTNNCNIRNAGWEQEDDQLVFKITADRFLRNMVRAIVGTLINAGLNKMEEQEFRLILESKERSKAGTSVPAHGLYLVEIKYPFNTL